MQIKSSKTLLHFYHAWMMWVVSGAEEQSTTNTYGFRRNEGLCFALERFMPSTCEEDDILWDATMLEMKEQFEAAGLYCVYPFGVDNYNSRNLFEGKGTQHQDPVRLQWVQARILDGEETDED